VRDAFRAAQRQLEDYVHRLRTPQISRPR
jgi:hypothetical protein